MVASPVANSIKRVAVTNGTNTRRFLATPHHHSLLKQSGSLSTTLLRISGGGWNICLAYVPPDQSLPLDTNWVD